MDWNGPKLAGMDLNGLQWAGRARSKWDGLLVLLEAHAQTFPVKFFPPNF